MTAFYMGCLRAVSYGNEYWIYGNNGFSVTILAMFCQNALNPSSLKENNAIPVTR